MLISVVRIIIQLTLVPVLLVLLSTPSTAPQTILADTRTSGAATSNSKSITNTRGSTPEVVVVLLALVVVLRTLNSEQRCFFDYQ